MLDLKWILFIGVAINVDQQMNYCFSFLYRLYLKLDFFLVLLWSSIFDSKIYPKIVLAQITDIFDKNKSKFGISIPAGSLANDKSKHSA